MLKEDTNFFTMGRLLYSLVGFRGFLVRTEKLADGETEGDFSFL